MVESLRLLKEALCFWPRLTSPDFEPGTVPSLTQIIPCYQEARPEGEGGLHEEKCSACTPQHPHSCVQMVIPTSDFLRKGFIPGGKSGRSNVAMSSEVVVVRISAHGRPPHYGLSMCHRDRHGSSRMPRTRAPTTSLGLCTSAAELLDWTHSFLNNLRDVRPSSLDFGTSIQVKGMTMSRVSPPNRMCQISHTTPLRNRHGIGDLTAAAAGRWGGGLGVSMKPPTLR